MSIWHRIGTVEIGGEEPGLTAALEADGLDDEARAALAECLGVYAHVLAKNVERRRYYDGDVDVKNIGIDTVPETVDVRVSCDWPRKACTSVSERSRFDGYVFESGLSDPALDAIVRRNGIDTAYSRFVNSELQHGCMSATVADVGGLAQVRFHSAETCAMVWDNVADRIAYGMAIADASRPEWAGGRVVVTRLNLYLSGRTVRIDRIDEDSWTATSVDTPLDRPAMESFVFRPTGSQPFGTSCISKPLMKATDAALRIMRDVQVAAAMDAAPQKYALGLSTEQFLKLVNDKKAAYVGSMFLTTTDDNGNHPDYGQLPGASMSSFTDLLSMWARQVSSMTGVPLSQLGVVSSNEYYESTEALVMAAEDLNASNGESLRNVALMAMRMEGDLTDAQRGVMAHFKNPARPSIAAATDAMVKIGSQDPAIVGTDFYYEQLGYSQAEIARIQSERVRNQSLVDIGAIIRGEEP